MVPCWYLPVKRCHWIFMVPIWYNSGTLTEKMALTSARAFCTMSPTMARKQPKKSDKRDFHLRTPPGMIAALEKLADRRRRSVNLMIVLVLEEELRREGLWPAGSSGRN